MSNSTCKGCGRELVWAKNPETGKMVPLDPTCLVYMFDGEECVPQEHGVYMVSHFNTCRKADDFSGSKK